MNVPLNDLWIKSLLFDLNYKFIKIGASLLALAKSIYYLKVFFLIVHNNSHSSNVNDFECFGELTKLNNSFATFPGMIILCKPA